MKAPLSLLWFALAAQSTPVSRGELYARSDALNACLDAAALQYVDESASSWEVDILPHNMRLPVTPRAIVYATAVGHVQDAVACAATNGVKVAAKSGGHSYGSYGLGGSDGHLVIQLDRMFEVTLREDNTALVQTGSRLGNVASELWNQGKRAIVHGTCPSVGVGGHVLHGGFGFSSHTHGLALDLVIGANVVLANGTLVHTSKTENPDLFWAIRGAGSSFGIVVELEFETFEPPEELTWLSIVSNFTSKGPEAAAANLIQFQSILESGGIAKELNMRLGLNSGGGRVLEVTYHGPKEKALRALRPLRKPLALDFESNATTIGTGPWLDHVIAWSNGDPLNITYPFLGHDNSYISSLVTKKIPVAGLKSFANYILKDASQADSPPWWFQMDVHGDPNSGVINAADASSSSYAHRDKLWLFQFSSPMALANSTAPGIKLVNGFMNSISSHMQEEGDWGRYANYLDSELSREVATTEYWASNLPRLEQIKAQFDSANVFENPQSIEPAE